MDLFTAKALAHLAYPLSLVLLLLFIASIQTWRGRWSGGVLTALSIGLLWVCAMPATSERLAAAMESQFTPLPVEEYPQVDAIVVLGGALSVRPGGEATLELHESADRLYQASRLYHAGRSDKILCTGGTMPWRKGEVAEAWAMGRLLIDLGVPESQLIRESRSANTRENALNTRALMEQHHLKRVLLVTTAMHMPRALLTFQRAGIEVIAAPADYRSLLPHEFTLLDYLPSADALAMTTDVVREIIGLWYYRLRGWA